MNSEPGEELTEEEFLDAVAAVRFMAPDLSPVGAAILCALQLGIAADSRSFSLKLGLEHALTLREITALSSKQLGLVRIVRRDPRTQRTVFALSEAGETLVSRAFIQK